VSQIRRTRYEVFGGYLMRTLDTCALLSVETIKMVIISDDLEELKKITKKHCKKIIGSLKKSRILHLSDVN